MEAVVRNYSPNQTKKAFESVFYICPTCFTVCESNPETHRHPMVRCDAGRPGDERRRPVTGSDGRILSRAPYWFMEAVGRI
jgi:hypothetical protein